MWSEPIILCQMTYNGKYWLHAMGLFELRTDNDENTISSFIS